MSYRQSLYPGSLSQSSQPSQSQISALASKQREVEHFHQILQHSENLLQLYQAYADKYNVLVGGSEAVGDVVEHWQNVFRATGLALGSIQEQKQSLSTPDIPPHQVELSPSNKIDRVVRIPVKAAVLPSSDSPTPENSSSTTTTA